VSPSHRWLDCDGRRYALRRWLPPPRHFIPIAESQCPPFSFRLAAITAESGHYACLMLHFAHLETSLRHLMACNHVPERSDPYFPVLHRHVRAHSESCHWDTRDGAVTCSSVRSRTFAHEDEAHRVVLLSSLEEVLSTVRQGSAPPPTAPKTRDGQWSCLGRPRSGCAIAASRYSSAESLLPVP